MQKFLKRGIILPIVIALVSGLLLFAVTDNGIEGLLPADNGARILLHDSTNPSQPPAGLPDDAELSSLDSGAVIGTLISGSELDMRYNPPYSLAGNCASVQPCSSVPGRNGCVYIKLMSSDAENVGDSVTLDGIFGTHSYKRIKKAKRLSENGAQLLMPRAESALVIYFRTNGKNGISSDYSAYVYEEVA